MFFAFPTLPPFQHRRLSAKVLRASYSSRHRHVRNITGFVLAVKGKTKKVQEERRLINQQPGMAVAPGQAVLHGAGGAAKAPYFACLKYSAG